MSDFIPEELLLKIFQKSTPQTLIRCRCVCKSWRSLISSPSFISDHLAAQKPHLLIRESTKDLQIGLQNYFLFRPQSLPGFDLCFRSSLFHTFHIIGTVNGVICLADDISGITNNVILWNPLIGKFISASTSLNPSLPRRFSSKYGFGFDPKTNDLKIVRIVWDWRSGPYSRPYPFLSNAEVYTFGESKWSPVNFDRNVETCMLRNRWSQCLLNGSAHWVGSLMRGSTTDVLLSFNFEKDEFNIIELPIELLKSEIHVTKLGSLLSVLSYKGNREVLGSHGCDIWAMKVYGDVSSWCKMVNFRWDGGSLTSVLWVREDGGEMVISNNDQELVCCDSGNQTAKLLGVRCKGDGYFADEFVGSLVLLDFNDN